MGRRVLFVDQTDGHDPHQLYDKPTGGTLTSLTMVPEHLAAKGHEVYVCSKYAPKDGQEVVKGVTYIARCGEIPKWDVTVFNRNALPANFVQYCQAQGSKLVWWLHDIVDTRYLTDGAFTLMDRVVALSQYCQDTYVDFYGVDPAKFKVIPNGIDPAVFYPGEYEKRNPHTYLSASALIKGYTAFPLVYENLKRIDPDLDFRFYSSQKLHGIDNSDAQASFLKLMGAHGARIYAPTNQKVLAHIMRKAWALLMPNTYPEICSNLLLQARACGLPVVASHIGANKEFLDRGGLLTSKWFPHDIHSWSVEYAQKACELQSDAALHKKLSADAPQGVPTWSEVGDAWHDLISSL